MQVCNHTFLFYIRALLKYIDELVINYSCCFSWILGKLLLLALAFMVRMGKSFLWLWRKVTPFFCLNTGELRSSSMKKSMYIFHLLIAHFTFVQSLDLIILNVSTSWLIWSALFLKHFCTVVCLSKASNDAWKCHNLSSRSNSPWADYESFIRLLESVEDLYFSVKLFLLMT